MASFEKMKFEEIINGEDIQFFINGKKVEEDTYNTLLNDDSLYNFPPLPSPENKSNINNKYYSPSSSITQEEPEICDCEQCTEFLTIINDIRKMDDYQALEGLKNYIELVKMQALSEVYSELGTNMIKISSRLEDKIEAITCQLYSDEEEI